VNANNHILSTRKYAPNAESASQNANSNPFC
jgi:hypothetical protein